MSLICFNNTFIDEATLQLPLNDRAFRYGDGLFETIIYNGKEILFWEDHLSRLNDGIRLLSMSAGDNLADELRYNITQLIHVNGLHLGARIRVQAWRKEGGLYTPSDLGLNYLLQSFALINAPVHEMSVEFCKKIRLSYSSISHLKTCNALPYIIASMEKQQMNVDDLIMLDTNGNISEATSANVFWLSNDTWYTPSLRTGCIGGVMRSNVIRKLSAMNFEVREVEEDAKSLLKSSGIFLTNVTGIRVVRKLENVEFETQYISSITSKLLFALNIKSKEV